MDETWTIKDVPTPALIIDAEKVRANLQRLVEYTHSQGIRLRPHTKTHKLARVSRMQMEAGAVGLTVAKVGEAEVMRHECAELLIAYPPVDIARARRAAEVARECRLLVGIDSLLAAERLADAASEVGTELGILIDLDVGFHRTGVQSPELAVELGRQVERFRRLTIKGIMYFPGQIGGPSEAQTEQLAEVEALVHRTVGLFGEAGLNCEIVSGGSTPTTFQSHLLPSTTEIRPGTNIYNDLNSVRFGVAAVEDCAATIAATVVSTSVQRQVVLDAGSKTLTSDRNAVDPDAGYGLIVEYPEAKIAKLSEEHGQVDVSHCERPPRLGERVTIIPNHICPCVNLQNTVWWSEAGALEELPVDARGLLV